MGYYVFLWAEAGEQWVPVKEIRREGLQLIIAVDSSERLTYDEADARCELLKEKHPNRIFKVAKFD